MDSLIAQAGEPAREVKSGGLVGSEVVEVVENLQLGMAGVSSLSGEPLRDARQDYQAEDIPVGEGEYPFTRNNLDTPKA